jgi:hypothetical protein
LAHPNTQTSIEQVFLGTINATRQEKKVARLYHIKPSLKEELFMQKFFLGAIVIILALSGGTSYLSAQSTEDRIEAAVQSLGSKTRDEMTRAGKSGADTDHALRFQTEGDQALRRNELAHAAEEYGRAEENISALNRERTNALQARTRAARELIRARRAGTVAARAQDEIEKGNLALDNGDYVEAQLHYDEARAFLAG